MIDQKVIVKKMREENRKLSQNEIEKIVQEVVAEIEKEADEELSKTVMGTD